MAKIVQWRSKDAPVCCHEGADFHNIGCTKMILPDGTPIEAELYRYDENITLSIVMPQFNIRHKNIRLLHCAAVHGLAVSLKMSRRHLHQYKKNAG